MTRMKTPVQAELIFSKMLFLVSHGLQTPLSAIRWGCGRLKRTGGNFSPEQKLLLDGILGETRLLSRMFDWMLLLAKNEEGAHEPDIQEIFVPDFFTSPKRTEDLPRVMALEVTCPPDLMISADRTLFSAIIDALLLAASVGSDAPSAKIFVSADEDTCVITITVPMALSLLTEQTNGGKEGNRVVGGVPGFLLAIASSLTQSCEGTLEPEEQDGVIRHLTLHLPLRVPGV